MSTNEGKWVQIKESEYKWRKVCVSGGRCVYSYRIVMLLVAYLWASMTFLPIFCYFWGSFFLRRVFWSAILNFMGNTADRSFPDSCSPFPVLVLVKFTVITTWPKSNFKTFLHKNPGKILLLLSDMVGETFITMGFILTSNLPWQIAESVSAKALKLCMFL